MTFSGHAAVSVLTLCVTRDPWILVPLNIALHFVLDAVPHAEFFFIKNLVWRTFVMLIDIAIVIFLFWFAFISLHASREIIATAFLASIFPDLFDPITRKYFPQIRKFHIAMHSVPLPPTEPVNWDRTYTGNISKNVKLAIQIGIIGIALVVLFLSK